MPDKQDHTLQSPPVSAHFLVTIATHSSKQTLYFDESGLIKRNDHDVEIAGGTSVACHDHVRDS